MAQVAENAETDRQPDAATGTPTGPLPREGRATAVRCCSMTTKAGTPCRMPPIFGTDLCKSHTPGLAAVDGRKGGLNRRRPVPPPRVVPDPALPQAATTPPPVPAAPMDAHQVRIYLENLTRNVAVGRLDPAIARAATATAAQWLKAIAMDEKTQDVEKRIAALEKRAGPEKAS